MLPAPFVNALVLTGPTGSGKTQFGIELAEELGAEIVSMDSMALYRGMDVGTAKPTAEQRARVPHHLIDVLDPWESASVAWWLQRAAECCRLIEDRGKRVLFVGGTPLYLKALMHGLFDGPPADSALRQRLERQAQEEGPSVLHRRLAEVDPVSAVRLHPNDVRRVVRALEVWELTGRALSDWQRQWPGRGVDGGWWMVDGGREADGGRWTVGGRGPDIARSTVPLASTNHQPPTTIHHCLWLDLPRPELYERINRRVEEMFASGLVDEVRALRQLPRPLSRESAQALGYKEVFAYLDGQVPREPTMELVKTRSRNFAKRQVTWFRHLPGCRPVSRQLTRELWHPTIT